jgi:geranylgeranyl pyrophosphate synthase
LPALLGIKHDGEFKRRWHKRPFHSDEIPELAEILINEGVQQLVESETARYTELANKALDQLDSKKDAFDSLRELANQLLTRKQ